MNHSTSNAVEIVCHRGANGHAPENTYPSAKTAIELGADYVEIDVNVSKDGEFFVFHGPDLARTTNGVGLISDLPAAAIDELDAGSWFGEEFSGEPVPRLAPFLDWIKGRAGVFFDVKAGDLEALVGLVRGVGLQEESFFWFRSPDRAMELRALAPELTLKINARSVADVIVAHERYRAGIVEVGLENLSHELIDACRSRGIRVMAYQTQNDRAAFREILERGVDMVNLDHADVFLEVAREFYEG